MTVVEYRTKAITTRVGVINVCPNCGRTNVTDWTWDMALDPYRDEFGALFVAPQAIRHGVLVALEAIAVEHGRRTELECLPGCLG